MQKHLQIQWKMNIWRRGWDSHRRNLLLGRVGTRFFVTVTHCIPSIYFYAPQTRVNTADHSPLKSRKCAKVVARR